MRPRHGSRDQRLGTSRANLRERARFRRLGLTPFQRSTGGKREIGGTSRGERTIRRLLIIGASAVVHWAVRKGVLAGS